MIATSETHIARKNSPARLTPEAYPTFQLRDHPMSDTIKKPESVTTSDAIDSPSAEEKENMSSNPAATDFEQRLGRRN